MAGVIENIGTKNGGTQVNVVGFGFNEPGAGPTSVLFAGTPASSVTVLSSTLVGVTTPAGVNGHGNPLPQVDVALTNALGSSTASQAYLYTPALSSGDPAQLGGLAGVFLQSEPGDLVIYGYGLLVPGVVFAVPGLDGVLELVTGFAPLSSLAPSPAGVMGFTIPVPDSPALVGLTIQMQGFAVQSIVPALTGAFTNVLSVPLMP